jgi:hypothetical protein
MTSSTCPACCFAQSRSNPMGCPPSHQCALADWRASLQRTSPDQPIVRDHRRRRTAVRNGSGRGPPTHGPWRPNHGVARRVVSCSLHRTSATNASVRPSVTGSSSPSLSTSSANETASFGRVRLRSDSHRRRILARHSGAAFPDAHSAGTLHRSRRCTSISTMVGRPTTSDGRPSSRQSRVWNEWRAALVIVKPETVIAWHRHAFCVFWSWKSRRRIGRSPVPPAVQALIRRMSDANPRWGAPRIHGELLKLGMAVSQSTVAKYMVRRRQPPSQTWRTFLANHVEQIMAADFFVVPTVRGRLLFVLAILAHERRRVVHVAVTEHPTAAWTAQQLREAFPWDRAPRYIIRDRDHAFAGWADTAQAMGVEEVLTAPRSP